MLPEFHSLRRHPRLYALLGMLALCLQLVASGVGSVHAAERLANSTSGVIEICTAAGIIRITADGTEYPQAQNARQHCPFCATSSLPPPLAVTLSFFLTPPAAADFLPVAAMGALPAAPDQRHAPNRAPPSRFA